MQKCVAGVQPAYSKRILVADAFLVASQLQVPCHGVASALADWRAWSPQPPHGIAWAATA